MARLDRFLEAALAHGGQQIRLTAGQPVRMVVGNSLRPLSKSPLDEAQVAGLIKELAPADMVPLLGPTARLSFSYASSVGGVEVELAPEGGRTAAVLKFKNGRPAASSSPPEAEREPAREEMETLLRLLIEREASDLHLRVGEPPVLRRDGDLVRQSTDPLEAAHLERLLWSIMPNSTWQEWRRRNDVDWACEIPGVARFRGNAGRDRNGVMAVFRRISSAIPTVEDLGLSREVQQLCALTKGLVLVTGPTGSGKSTTLAAMVDLINQTRNDHILTIEDPIEFVHVGKQALVTQREVGDHTESFGSALRAALREDPDVVLVGELRDLETITIALETAETGHLVFGALHTTTAAGSVDRIIDQFPAGQQPQIRIMLAECLRGVVAQVLCRRQGGGRVAAREILIATPSVTNLIREGKTFQIPSVMQTSRKAGMVTMNDALLKLVDAGQVDPEEAYLRATDKAGLRLALQSRGHSTEVTA
ncbi:MAG: type IV pilus twitching motility protein PilT [Gemmatimonadota bacterium]